MQWRAPKRTTNTPKGREIIIVKKGIFVALAALALAVAAVADANGAGEPDINLRAWGGNLISSDEGGIPTPPNAPPLTVFQSGKTKGSSGSPSLFGSVSIPAFDPALVPTECEGLPGGPLFQTIVLTYDDGSMLSLVAGPGSYYCTDGIVFTFEAFGEVRAGAGRFEGVTGKYGASGQTLPPGGTGLFTADISIHFE
jgi:hypothetical protein